MWNVVTGKNIATFKPDSVDRAAMKDPNNMTYSVAFSPDGKTLALGCYNGLIRVLDVTTGKKIAALTGHTAPVRSLAFSPDGTTLASASNDSTVKLWGAENETASPAVLSAPAVSAPSADRTLPTTSRKRQHASEGAIAIAAALNWLHRHQTPEGNWSIDYRRQCKGEACSGAGITKSDAAATAVALLPFLAAGQTQTSKGPYRPTVAKGIAWLIKQQKPSGDLSGGCEQPMYAQGLATIALCEAYGMTHDEHLGAAARLGVGYIERAQNEASGGWGASPGDPGDTFTFGWQIMALKSAQLVGLPVNSTVFKNAQRWLHSVGKGQHLGLYSHQPNGEVTPAMTAVGMLARQYMGVDPKDPGLLEGKRCLLENLPDNQLTRNTSYWYYATQAMHNFADHDWDTWNRKMRRVLLDTQVKEGCAIGSWDPDKPTPDIGNKDGGRLLTTSLSALCLEGYYRYLSLFRGTSKEPNADETITPRVKKDKNQPLSPAAGKMDRRAVNKRVKDFPEKTDLSTPESAMAAWNRCFARRDIRAALELSWAKMDAPTAKVVEDALKHDRGIPKNFSQIVLDTEIVEVLTYHDDFAAVVYKESLTHQRPYGLQYFARINGKWKCYDWRDVGRGSSSSADAAANLFESKKDELWRNFVKLRNDVLAGHPPMISGKRQPRSLSAAEEEKIKRFQQNHWYGFLSLDMPTLDPQVVQYAIFDKDPVAAFKALTNRTQSFNRKQLEEAAAKGEGEQVLAIQMTVHWDLGFKDVSGDRLNLLSFCCGKV